MKHTNDRATQILLSLLKQHGVKRIIASPGSMNCSIVASAQYDPFFQVFSCVDERSAAYMACGMSATSGEPVVLTCTGATSSRNYLPGMTEAYYRKLPVIAVTPYGGTSNIGQLVAQNIDRSVVQNDVAVCSVDIPLIKDEADAAYCNRQINNAILASCRHGGGPVHINLAVRYHDDFLTFSEGEVKSSRVIRRYTYEMAWPTLNKEQKIGVVVGTHVAFSESLKNALDGFCASHNVIVFVDQTSNYHGEYALLSTLTSDNLSPYQRSIKDYMPDLIIHIGEVSGDYPIQNLLASHRAPVWRVSADGEIRDRFNDLQNVFECSEEYFFTHYASTEKVSHHFYDTWKRLDTDLRAKTYDLPFSNRWIAKALSSQIPSNSIVHFAILNSLRSWNYWPMDSSIRAYSNTGGFGIDGALSTLLGSSLAEPETLHFGFVGDLAFFYDMNALGNRQLANNIRILLVNNGTGGEFHMQYSLPSALGKDVNEYIAATGHFYSKQSGKSAAQVWAEAMGLTYMSAHSKEEFKDAMPQFVDLQRNKPILFECFIDPEDDAKAGAIMSSLNPDAVNANAVKKMAKKILPKKAVSTVKSILRK